MKSKRYSVVHIGLVTFTLAGPASIGVPEALGQGVAPPLGGSVTSHQLDPGPPGWGIDDGAGNPQVVIRDPNGPPWGKELTGQNPGDPVVAVSGDTFAIRETLLVGGNLSWEDWHEEILTPDWEWVDTAVNPISIFVDGNPATGLSIMNMPAGGGVGGALWFDFDPIFPGSVVDIVKNIQYVGAPGQTFSGTIRLIEYPTPEPGTMALLGTGGLALLRRRRRRLAAG